MAFFAVGWGCGSSGRYVVYSRAVGSNGAAESEFTAKDGNRKPIFVH